MDHGVCQGHNILCPRFLSPCLHKEATGVIITSNCLPSPPPLLMQCDYSLFPLRDTTVIATATILTTTHGTYDEILHGSHFFLFFYFSVFLLLSLFLAQPNKKSTKIKEGCCVKQQHSFLLSLSLCSRKSHTVHLSNIILAHVTVRREKGSFLL
jgi:hypothetical protein